LKRRFADPLASQKGIDARQHTSPCRVPTPGTRRSAHAGRLKQAGKTKENHEIR